MATDKKLTITFFLPGAIGLFYPEYSTVFGGAELNLFNLAVEMAKDTNYKVVFWLDDYGQISSEMKHGICLKKLRFNNRTRYPGKFFKWVRVLNLAKTIFFMNTDVIITSAASEMLYFISTIISRVRRKISLFRLAHDRDVDFSYWRRQSNRFGELYEKGVRRTSALLVQSEFQQSALEKQGFRNVYLVRNGFPIRGNELDSREFCLWVGRAVEFKRPMLLLEIAKELPLMKFVMILPANENKTSMQLKEDIAMESKKLNNVEIIDFVPFHDIQNYFERAIVYINTSSLEGFPNTFIQAALASVPILTLGVNPDGIITERSMGYVADNPKQAAQWLKHATNNDLSSAGKNALAYVSEKHDIQEKANEYKLIIQQHL